LDRVALAEESVRPRKTCGRIGRIEIGQKNVGGRPIDRTGFGRGRVAFQRLMKAQRV
jgi:hypothetical protein